MKQLFVYFQLVLFPCLLLAQSAPKPYGALPTPAQLKWHEMEMYCLIHYGVDTYTDKEWGYGDESASLINPSHFDAEQIVAAAKAGGFKGIVVVAKHHDGLCLWPTKTTSHNISAAPWRNGKGDMVKEYQLACKKLGMKMGVYCSPWDRNNSSYGTAEYVSIYRRQLKELYSNYGPLFISWHDGANGGDGYYGGANEKRTIDRSTYYGWDSTFRITRTMQPSAVIFGDIGPDVRWVGNEEGHAGETCWATYTPVAPDEGHKPSNGYVKYRLGTEGTRNGKYWMPAECDVPLRPGWFYHASQDAQVKSPYTLLDLYYKSVGRGADLDLGLAPGKSGQLHPNDVNSLKQFGELLQTIFRVNLAKEATFSASNVRGNNTKKFGPSFLVDGDRFSYWATDDNVFTPQLVIDLRKPTTFNVIRLRENIKLGQRITSFAVDVDEKGRWKEIATATSVGANRLIRLQQNVTAQKLRLRITGADACIALSDFGLFKEPPHLTAPIVERNKEGLVEITTMAPVVGIHYTTNGTEPSISSPVYDKPFSFVEGGIVKAKSFEEDTIGSETASKRFGLSKKGWTITLGTNISNAKDAIDEDDNSFLSLPAEKFPVDIIIDMSKPYSLKAFTYLPRQDKKADGIVDKYSIAISEDGLQWKQVASGEFSNIKANPVEQRVPLEESATARYIKFSVLHVVSGSSVSVAEMGVDVR
ncbi:MAG: alpha-L-fucosidase [Flavisolibacter sp.]